MPAMPPKIIFGAFSHFFTKKSYKTRAAQPKNIRGTKHINKLYHSPFGANGLNANAPGVPER
jgi:hypothetical protein